MTTNITVITKVSAEVATQFGGMVEPTSGLPVGILKVTGFAYVDMTRKTNENGIEKETVINTRRPIKVLTTDKNEVYIFFGTIDKIYLDKNDVEHKNGGEVYELWRNINATTVGQTNDARLQALYDAVKDKELVVTEKFIWVQYEKDGVKQQPQAKRLVNINFKK